MIPAAAVVSIGLTGPAKSGSVESSSRKTLRGSTRSAAPSESALYRTSSSVPSMKGTSASTSSFSSVVSVTYRQVTSLLDLGDPGD